MVRIKSKEKNNFKETILVTGGCGFIGSNFLNIFVPKYPNITFVNVDSLTYAGRIQNVDVRKSANYKFEKVDIRDRRILVKVFSEYNPTGIIHFAAESHVDISISNPGLFIETNILGTHNLLDLAKEFKVGRFLQVSTDEVYGSLGPKDPPFTELSPLAPNSPYSASKAAAELLVRSYYKTFGLDAIITRCSNNFGPNQDSTKLIPKFIKNLLSDKKVPLYATGSNVRDWIYVTDHVEALDLIFRQGKSGEIYNIGGNHELTNLEITKELLKLTRKNENMIEYVTDRPAHDFRYALNFSKLTNELGWMPKVDFSDGLQKTLSYNKDNK